MLHRLWIPALLFATVMAAEFRTERVFGPEVPTGPYKHPACITELRNGDLYLVYYGGAGEYATDTSVFGSRQPKGAKTWSAPRVIAHDPFRSTGNGVVWQAPDGAVWLLYVVRFGETWSTSRIQAKISQDSAETWSDASMVDLREGSMVRGHPIALHGGDYLIPIYHETGTDIEMVGPDSASLFLRFDPRKLTWTRTNEIRSRIGNIQPAAAQITDDFLVAYCRRGGGYGPVSDGFLVRSESRDGGRTWSPGADTSFPNPNSAVDFLKLSNGHLLLVYNDSMHQRTPLTAAISTDNDRTYPLRRNIAEGRNDFAYPSAIQTADGLIHVVYTSDGRKVVNHAVFSEDWVTGDRAARHVTVYRDAGRFGGWPANHGIWSWGNEILVGFEAGWFKRQTPDRHQVDNTRPGQPSLARSLDGGETWSIETPRTFQSPEGGAAPTDLPAPIDFQSPGFAMTLRLTDVNRGPSRLLYSYDRGRTWRGPYHFPLLGQPGIAARTDYIVNGNRDALVFLTASKSNGREGRVLCARTNDGGMHWQFVSWLGEEPPGFSIMPSSVRLSSSVILTATRVKQDQSTNWIDLYRSADNGMSWQLLARPVPSTGGFSGNPPSLIRLRDGRLCLTYGYRSAPFGIRARTSGDQGKTWGPEINLRTDGAAWDLGYTRSVQRPDGKIVTVYYFAERADSERIIAATIWDAK